MIHLIFKQKLIWILFHNSIILFPKNWNVQNKKSKLPWVDSLCVQAEIDPVVLEGGGELVVLEEVIGQQVEQVAELTRELLVRRWSFRIPEIKSNVFGPNISKTKCLSNTLTDLHPNSLKTFSFSVNILVIVPKP